MRYGLLLFRIFIYTCTLYRYRLVRTKLYYAIIPPTLQYNNSSIPPPKQATMSTEETRQLPGVGANPLLPFDENQIRLCFKAVNVLLKKSVKPEEWSIKAQQPLPSKGDPEDLERFLRQLENVFTLQHRTFQEDIRKIWYPANLLHRNKNDKFGDPATSSWYESYHLKIDANAAQRAPGSPIEYLNPKFREWSTFVEVLRSSFSNRVSREQAIMEWHLLKHTNSINDYLDKLIRLMWWTGYKGQTIEDKLKRGLNHKLGKDWARVINKLETVDEHITLLREIGHRIEDYNRTK